ncbi:MAG: hypothetical protein R6U26_00795 [Candidatus Undinarchaeales archaeon]
MNTKTIFSNFFKSKNNLFLLVAGFAVLLLATFVGIFYVAQFFKILAIWFLSLGFFILMRLPDSWKMGLEVFYLFTFIYAYLFDLFFVLPLLYTALLIVVKIRPDEGSGAFVHSIVLTGTALTARFFFSLYGLGISQSEFVFAALFTLVVWFIGDTIIALKTAPVPLPKLVINHTLEFIINYFIITLFGYKILNFFMNLL